MKLILKRSQADVTGFLGGHKGVSFNLHCKSEVTSEERLMIDRYKIGDQVLASYNRKIGDSGKDFKVTISVYDLINGKDIQMEEIGTMLELEESIKQGTKKLKEILKAMQSFGGEEEIIID